MPVTRTDNDLELAEILPVGFRDSKSPKFIPPELRALVAAIPADVENKLRKAVATTRTTLRSFDSGRRVVELRPADNADDFETALVWRKVEWAATQLAGARVEREQQADDAARFTCSCCSAVKAFDTKGRRLVDGTTVAVCSDCFPVLDRLALDHLAAHELPTGTTRLDAARALLAQRGTP